MQTRIDSEKACLLANLILIAIDKNQKYFNLLYCNKSREEKILEERKLFSNELKCNSRKDFDPSAPNHNPSASIKVIRWLWHTDKPILKRLSLRTLPFGFIGVNEGDKEVYIVLRGTITSEEWRRNFAFKMTESCPNTNILGLVHRGFHSIFTFNYTDRLRSPSNILIRAGYFISRKDDFIEHDKQISISEGIFESIVNDNWHQRGYKIYITGYSLGGALAMLSGQMLLSNDAEYSKILSICTFGAPRVGNEGFAAWFDGVDVVRYVNSEDVVPTVPPPTAKLFGSDMKDDSNKLMIIEREAGYRSISKIFEANKGAIKYNHNKDLQSREKAFVHIGTSRVFTHNEGSISYNHNLFRTYREGIERISHSI